MNFSSLHKFCFVCLVTLCVGQIDLTTEGWGGELQHIGEAKGADVYLEAAMPPHPTDRNDEYLCTSIDLLDVPMKLVSVEPLSEETIVHHMLLFGCNTPASTDPVWSCRMAPACGSGGESVLYGWGKNAPAVHLPADTGFSVGPGTATRTVVLQVHYLKIRPDNDRSGVRLHLSPNPVTYSAGLIAFASSFAIPPRNTLYKVPNECCYSGFEPLHSFAFRVHTHALGKRVFLEHSTPSGVSIPADGDPQSPQGFYPVSSEAIIHPGDSIKATCEFDSSSKRSTVAAGHTATDEMCNLYLMIYSEIPHFGWCVDSNLWIAEDSAGGVPLKATLVPCPSWNVPNVFDDIQLPSLEAAADDGHNTNYDDDASTTTTKTTGKEGKKEEEVDMISMPLGQIAGLAVDRKGEKSTLWAFHRGFRTWTARSFNELTHVFAKQTPIRWPAILQLERDTGKVVSSIGAGMFYMPHMISLDSRSGDLFVVDTGLHQVFKMSPSGDVILTLGQKLKPGTQHDHFCMPTHAISSRDGSIYVADGYCNSRVVKFDSLGTFIKEYTIPKSKDNGNKKIPPLPHSIVLDECRDRLYVADREIGRVLALSIDSGAILEEWDLKHEYGLPYAIAMGPYGQILALTWDREGTDSSRIVLLSTSGHRVTTSWELPGVRSPHDLEVAPAPLSVTQGGERLLSIFVAETAAFGTSTIKKFILHPEHGTALAVVDKTESDTHHDHDATSTTSTSTVSGDDIHAHEPTTLDNTAATADDALEHAASHGHGALKPVDQEAADAAAEKFAREKEIIERERAEQERLDAAAAEAAAAEAAARAAQARREKEAAEADEIFYDMDRERNSAYNLFVQTLRTPLGLSMFFVMVLSGGMLVYGQYEEWSKRRRPIQHIA